MSDVEYLGGRTPPAPEPPPASPGSSFQPEHDLPEGSRRTSSPLDSVRRFGPRSLTSKLVTGVVSLVVVLVLLIGGGTYFALRAFLDNRLDQQLQSTVSQGVGNFVPDMAQNGPGPLIVYLVLLDPATGNVVASPAKNLETVQAINLGAAERKRVAGRTTSDPVTVRTTDGHELRITVFERQVRGFGATPLAVVVGLSTADEQETLHRLFLLELGIGGAAVVLALVATTYGVGFGLRRLKRVTTTAQEVAAELSPEGAGLDRRVPDDEPETEVGQLATSFNTLLSAVETQFKARLESEQRMRQFLADASHELRTPLTSIRGYAELARMQRSAGDDAEDNLHRIESEGTRMSRLVEDLLMLARNEDGENEHTAQSEPVDVPTMVDDAVSGARASFPERRIDLQMTAVPTVRGDRDQLLRVVRNLVTNACVHTQPDRPILVRAYPDGGGVTIQVVDGGPGLPPEDAAHVFERFWRADKARTRARGGSGLGLSIVATLIRAHGGTVRFDSSVEHGSTVSVWLPAVD